MMTWILVVNAAEAKILSTDNLRVGKLEPVQQFTHPESRKKISDLISDERGHYKTDSGIRGAYDKGNPKDIEAEHFSIQLLHEIKTGWDQKRFKNLIIVAPAHFYGLLKKHLHILGTIELIHIPKDYTKYTLPELHASLKEHLFG